MTHLRVNLFCWQFAFVSKLPSDYQQKRPPNGRSSSKNLFGAERQGFEPWIPEGITVFETAPIDHSGISPIGRTQKIYIFRPAKIRIKLKKQKFFLKFSRSTKPTSTLCSRLLEFAKIQNFSNHPSQPSHFAPICKE